MNTKIYFRADSNSAIASGHIMRCLSIACYLKKKGCSVCFLIADMNPINMLEHEGITYICLNSQWNDLNKEIVKVKDILSADKHPLLVIDTYQVTRQYVEEILPFASICYIGSKKEYLGDIHSIINYSADIDYDFYESNYDGGKTMLLLGPKYAPLREEFQSIGEHNSGSVKRILITTGNTDQNGIVSKILANISKEPYFSDVQIDVVVGAMFACKETLVSVFKEMPNIHFHKDVRSMSRLMAQSDLAITANGTTVYELIAAKVPVVSFAMVAEQVNSAISLEKLGAVEYCGKSYEDENNVIKNIVQKVMMFYMRPSFLKKQISHASEFIDGNGCARISRALLGLLK